MKTLKIKLLFAASWVLAASAAGGYTTDFSEVVAGDADGKDLPPVAVFPALSASPDIMHRNSSTGTMFISASDTSVADSAPPTGAAGNAAARVGDDSATTEYLNTLLSDVFAADTDFACTVRLDNDAVSGGGVKTSMPEWRRNMRIRKPSNPHCC